MAKLKIIMTGGGSAGHVTPNLALIPELIERGYEVQYIGTKDGMERGLIEAYDYQGKKIKYHPISGGKLRRYFDLKNFTDPFRVIKGIWEAQRIIKEENPDVVFSKGGFVSVPVVLGAYMNRVPVVAHESDITPGLANRIAMPYCTKICVTFPEALEKTKKGKGVLTGTPIRKQLLEGSRLRGLKLCGFSGEKPVLLVMGGSLGSRLINEKVRENLEALIRKYDVIHICGRGYVEAALKNRRGYVQYEYVGKELPDLFQCTDLVVSRAGANSLFELLALKKPNLLIPLSRKSSRGDQILNAASFEKSGYSLVLQEEELTSERFIKKIDELNNSKKEFVSNMSKSPISNGVDKVIQVIEESTMHKKNRYS